MRMHNSNYQNMPPWFTIVQNMTISSPRQVYANPSTQTQTKANVQFLNNDIVNFNFNFP